MGMLVTCNLWKPADQVAKCYLALLRRMPGRASLGSIDLCEKYPMCGHQITREFTDHRLDTLIPCVPDSENAIRASLAYSMPGELIPLTLELFGSRHNAPVPMIENDGPARAFFSYGDLTGDRIDYEALQAGATGDEVISLGNSKHELACEALLLLSGANNGTDAFDHAMLHLNECWVSPIGASILFHRDAREFARDFARMYANYHWGTRITRTLAPNVDIFSLEGQPRPYPFNSGPLDLYGEFGDEPHLIEFMQLLERTLAAELSELSEHVILELMRVVANKHQDVTLIEPASGGACVCVPLPQMLGTVYCAIVAEYLQ